MKMLKKLALATLVTGLCSTSVLAKGEPSKFVPISKGVKSIEMNLNGEKFTLMRNQTAGNKIVIYM